MATINQSTFQGRLTREPNYDVTPSGTKLYKMSIAVNNGKPLFKDGQRVIDPVTNKQKFSDDVLFIEVTAFNDVAQQLADRPESKLFVKGALISVDVKYEGINIYTKNDNEPGASVNWILKSVGDVGLIRLPSQQNGANQQQQRQQQNSAFSGGVSQDPFTNYTPHPEGAF